MSTAAITPPAAAPAAPAAPVTPAASTPAPAAPATTTPAAPAQPASLEERLGQAWDKVKAEPATTTEAPATETPAEEVTTAPVTEEVTTAAPESTEATTEQPTTEATTEAPTEEFQLDDGVPTDPAGFAAELKKDAAAQKFFEDRPELKSKVFAALRRDAENREIRQYVPDVDTAKAVTQVAATYQAIDNKFLQATTPEGAKGFLESWIREAMITDDQGKPVVGADGKYQLHPALPFILNTIFTNKLSTLTEQFKGDDRVSTALNILREVTSPSSPAQGEWPDELKPHVDRLTAKETALQEREQASARQEAERQQTANQQSVDRAHTKASDAIVGQLKQSFDRAGLSEFERKAAAQEIGRRVDALLEANQFYQSRYESILLEPVSEAREQRLTRHMLSYTNEIIGKVTAEVLREAKGGALQRQTERTDKVTDQKNASKTDPRGVSTTASSPQTKVTNEQLTKEYMAAHNGEKPSLDWILAEQWKRAKAPVVRR